MKLRHGAMPRPARTYRREQNGRDNEDTLHYDARLFYLTSDSFDILFEPADEVIITLQHQEILPFIRLPLILMIFMLLKVCALADAYAATSSRAAKHFGRFAVCHELALILIISRCFLAPATKPF